MNLAPEDRSRKRRKLSNNEGSQQSTVDKLPHSVAGSISPPPLRRESAARSTQEGSTRYLRSPFQLTWIRDLPASSNVDAVSLKDILGDPMIAECWEFNYLHDVDFLMEAFDSDVKAIVKVHVVHGFWKQEDESRKRLQLQASKYPNITLHCAYMPEMFGTHHSKMLILIRHDSLAQVIIHTANMIEFDWTNMTQAVWLSPLLPLIPEGVVAPESSRIGSGSKFKTDLLNYLRAYDTKRSICKPLIEQLSKFDFSEIRAALVASVPCRQDIETDAKTSWGWVGLKNVLSSVLTATQEPEIAVQVSSIATLGASDKWLDKTLFKTLGVQKTIGTAMPAFHVIFPTADEIRSSLNGYRSGSAIHTKIQSAAQIKQLQYLRPLLRHWAGDSPKESLSGTQDSVSGRDLIVPTASKPILDAGRKRAAPHIKTYVRFTDASKRAIDWMLVTSANLSKQAWGEAINANGEVRIASYEIGVLVWPELFGENATMVPTFKADIPTAGHANSAVIVGARMPYDLPLVPYAKDELPWCATASYPEPDWLGMAYNV